MKDKIRLTESEFREAIKESIRKYLTELDWKTYEYRKGEGWKLKESIDRIVKEAIEKTKN